MGKKIVEVRHKWRASYRGRIEADVAAAALDEIRKEHGKLTAQIVVEAARPDDSPLHPEFEWDDAKAAENYRARQARDMIRAIVVLDTTEQPEHAKFTLAKGADEDSPDYKPTELVVGRVDLFADAHRRLLGIVQAAQKAVDELNELAQSGGDAERMARVAVAQQAFSAAAAAVAALH